MESQPAEIDTDAEWSRTEESLPERVERWLSADAHRRLAELHARQVEAAAKQARELAGVLAEHAGDIEWEVAKALDEEGGEIVVGDKRVWRELDSRTGVLALKWTQVQERGGS